MKKLISSFVLVCLFIGVRSQTRAVNLEITLLSPIEYDFIQTDKPMDISVKIVNLGPSAMTEKDTLLFTVRYDGDTVYSAGKPLYKAFYYLPSGIAVNQTVTQMLWQGITQNYNNGGVHVYCLDAKLLNRNPTTGCIDPNYANNSGCHHVYTTIWANGVNNNASSQIKEGLQISPVPCTDKAKISYIVNEASNVNLILTDLQGKELIKVNDSYLNSGNYENEINVSGLAPGIYFATLNINGKLSTTKFIKQ